MPQVTCPNCGISINLKSRKEVDYNLVLKCLKSGPKTFTQLLHETHLPRKTLSLRLKELVNKGAIIKGDDYRLNGSSETAFESTRRSFPLKSKISRFIRENPNGNRDAFLIGIFSAFILLGPLLFARPFVVYGNRSHNFVVMPQVGKEFHLKIVVQGTENLYAWQGRIKFDPDICVVTGVVAGDFLSENTLVINSSDSSAINEMQVPGAVLVFTLDVKNGSLLIGGSLLGNIEGKSGGGILTTVTFNFLKSTAEYVETSLVGEIMLLSSDMRDAKGTLSAQIEE